MTQLCFFEDNLSKRMLPVTLTRPTDYIRIGILRIFEKWSLLTDSKFHTRLPGSGFSGLYTAGEPDRSHPCLWINARYLPGPDSRDEYLSLHPGEGLLFNGQPVVACLTAADTGTFFHQKSGRIEENMLHSNLHFSTTESGALIERPVDLFLNNTREIENDLKLLQSNLTPYAPAAGIHAAGDFPILTTGAVTIEPGTTFITANGPVLLGDGVHIMAGAVVRGPSAILDHSLIKMGSHIEEGTTIGPWCKVGGDVGHSILQGFSNKAHEGYLGSSYIGEWCNLGAGTITSNMKNTYGNIRMTDWSTGEIYDTGLQFCGMIMGDHSKTAIGTKINAGSSFGVFCNLISNGILSGYFPSFIWMTPDKTQQHQLEKALDTARIVMGRRNVELTPEYEKMVRKLFGKSAE